VLINTDYVFELTASDVLGRPATLLPGQTYTYPRSFQPLRSAGGNTADFPANGDARMKLVGSMTFVPTEQAAKEC